MQLSKALIVDTSLDILRNYGLADMTMRRVSAQLGVAPGALYWHFKNKQALIDATARHVLAPWLRTGFATLPEACLALRQAMLGIRDGAELVGAAVSNPDLRDELSQVLASTITGTNANIGATTALHYVLGSTAITQSEQQAKAAQAGLDPAAVSAQCTKGVEASSNDNATTGTSQATVECDASSDQFLAGVRLIDSGLRALEC
ncbi:TetR family transcriptional regulator [Corynebacterium gerontici]|uniref:TetR family transcriptional regulator n=1 Tax=Corynebacterium gerontici TaxID=2079234 RepID=UPI000F4DFAD3|nr:TetR family transcriptional regulator [Corynebacterium gerontici]